MSATFSGYPLHAARIALCHRELWQTARAGQGDSLPCCACAALSRMAALVATCAHALKTACRCPLIHRAIPRGAMGGIHEVFRPEASRQYRFHVNTVDGAAHISLGFVPLASAHVACHALTKSAVSRACPSRTRIKAKHLTKIHLMGRVRNKPADSGHQRCIGQEDADIGAARGSAHP